MTEIERRIIEAAIKFRKSFLEVISCVRGAEEKSEDWYLRKLPKRERNRQAQLELDEATDALIKERNVENLQR